jgi:dsDNA-binding SOS-regulon protein
LFLAYVNDIWRNIESKIRFFTDDCVIYRKIVNNYDVEKLQTDLDRLGDWAVENEMKINPNKSKALSFTRAQVKDLLNCTLRDQKIPEDNCCKCLGIIICSDLSWTNQVNYTVQKAWRALHFVMRVLKKGNNNMKSIAYKSLVRPILEYGAACWDPYRECQINALDRVQNKAAKFGYHTGGLDRESLVQRRKIARLCALFKVYTGERVWKAIGVGYRRQAT